MFKFDFNLEDTEPDNVTTPNIPNNDNELDSSRAGILKPPVLTILSPQDILEILPPKISYSPLRVPVPEEAQALTLFRRDLFDVRFQLISEPSAENTDNTDADELSFIDAPSDLLPDIYEGGLKTWECSIDLASHLHTLATPILERPTCNVLEIGCGTALPSLALLQKVFSLSPSNAPQRVFHLQDYNLVVLKLITLPNIILTWYLSPASGAYRSREDPPLPEPDFTEPGELTLTPELLSAFLKSLQEYNIDIKMISGAWQEMNTWIQEMKGVYDLIFSSETIYRTSSLPSLVSLLHAASTKKSTQDVELSEKLTNLSLDQTGTLCFIAAKVIYFGVGGGIDGFVEAVTQAGGRCRAVFEKSSGVNRRILQVTWDHDTVDTS